MYWKASHDIKLEGTNALPSECLLIALLRKVGLYWGPYTHPAFPRAEATKKGTKYVWAPKGSKKRSRNESQKKKKDFVPGPDNIPDFIRFK